MLMVVFAAVLLAVLLHGLANVLRRFSGLPLWASLAVVVLVIIALMAGLGLIAGPGLVDQAVKLFGAQHYDNYHFLLTIGDEIGGICLEHHRSSEDGTGVGTAMDFIAGIFSLRVNRRAGQKEVWMSLYCLEDIVVTDEKVGVLAIEQPSLIVEAIHAKQDDLRHIS